MYTDLIIHAANLINFSERIPKNYVEQIKRGELSAAATYDGTVAEGNLVGLSVTGSHAGWLEIVWLAMGENYGEEVQAADFLRYVMRRAEKSGNYIGAFSEIHMDEQSGVHRNILLLAGMELSEEKNNNYEITIGEMKGQEAFDRAAKLCNLSFVSEASDDLLTAVEDKMLDDPRPVPIPLYMDWDRYVADLSVICTEKDEPVGAMLFTEEKDHLVLELCYSNSVAAVPAMISVVLAKARDLYDGDKVVLLPIVGNLSEQLVKKLVPGARRGDMVSAVTWFEPYDAPKSLQMLMSQMTK